MTHVTPGCTWRIFLDTLPCVLFAPRLGCAPQVAPHALLLLLSHLVDRSMQQVAAIACRMARRATAPTTCTAARVNSMAVLPTRVSPCPTLAHRFNAGVVRGLHDSALAPFHLAIPVNSLDACREFYGKVLGLEEGTDGHAARARARVCLWCACVRETLPM